VEATPHPQAGAVTVSIGVAVASPDQENEFAATIEADKQLYAAKQAGRNRVSAKTALQVTQKGDAA
jgi:diguanylate cyclase